MSLGLLFAKGALRLLIAMAGENIARAAEIQIDPRILLFSGLVAAVTGILFGLAPAWHARRVDLQGTLKETARGSTSGRSRVRQILVIAEVALTFVLLIGAGLLLLSFKKLLQVNPGFETDRVLAFHFDLPGAKYPTQERQILHCQTILEKMRALPGVQNASLSSAIPLDNNQWNMRFVIEGQPEPAPHLQPSLQVTIVAPDYFQTIGIPLLQGRDFTPQDNRERFASAPPSNDWGIALNAIIIDEQFAQRHFPGQNPLGQRIRLPWGDPGKQPIMTIVGVVGRIKQNRLNEQNDMVQAYLPIFQQPVGGVAVVIKTSAEPAAMISAVRQQMTQLDPGQPVFGINTMQGLRDRNVAPDKLNLSLLGSFALLALLLAAIGLYGLLSFTVAQRQREIGVRMALGAKQSNVLNLIIGQGLRLILVGIVIGILGSLALTRVLATVLFQVQPTDPFAFLAVTITLGAVALLACYLPARRASKVDPMIALRCE